ncbi:hypothetical protein GWK47_007004 [Chionoecetes opilio]|uniref:Uncharacterized protein n=1 Tax=Chionoecetes opilio TaxID=41210 RepID=A0A8J4Y3J0_CHIOP|nr:hypothetical protein GWK47_007004 [Chionoecetes opilio]
MQPKLGSLWADSMVSLPVTYSKMLENKLPAFKEPSPFTPHFAHWMIDCRTDMTFALCPPPRAWPAPEHRGERIRISILRCGRACLAARGGRANSFFKDERVNQIYNWQHDLSILWIGSDDIADGIGPGHIIDNNKEITNAIERDLGDVKLYGWVYATSTPINVTLTCRNTSSSPSRHTLNGTGFVQISQGCNIHGDKFSLPASSTIIKEVPLIIQPFPFSKLLAFSSWEHEFLVNSSNVTLPSSFGLDPWSLPTYLDHLKLLMKPTPLVDPGWSAWNWMLLPVGIFTVFGGLYCTLRVRGSGCRRRSSPTSRPIPLEPLSDDGPLQPVACSHQSQPRAGTHS